MSVRDSRDGDELHSLSLFLSLVVDEIGISRMSGSRWRRGTREKGNGAGKGSGTGKFLAASSQRTLARWVLQSV